MNFSCSRLDTAATTAWAQQLLGGKRTLFSHRGDSSRVELDYLGGTTLGVCTRLYTSDQIVIPMYKTPHLGGAESAGLVSTLIKVPA